MLKKSHLRPLRVYSTLTLHNISSRQQQKYLPYVDNPLHHPSIPVLNAKHKKVFVGLKLEKTSIVTVLFRSYNKLYDYDQAIKDGGIERYMMLFLIEMQFLTVGEVYEVDIQEDCMKEEHMLEDMNDIFEEEGNSVKWTPAGDLMEVVSAEKCQFRIIA